MKVADGAADNWAYLSSDALSSGEEAVDFFHAGEHLHAAIATVQDAGHAAPEAKRDAVERQRRASDSHSEGMGSERPLR